MLVNRCTGPVPRMRRPSRLRDVATNTASPHLAWTQRNDIKKAGRPVAGSLLKLGALPAGMIPARARFCAESCVPTGSDLPWS